MIREAIILAGGLGTRLQSEVAQLPKSMAPVDGIPFLNFVISYLEKEGIEHFIFALGHQHEIISRYVDGKFSSISKTYSVEHAPLGTGGAIKKACEHVKGKDVIIVNGDTLFNIDLSKLSSAHQQFGADCTIALKHLQHFSRYGKVDIGKDGRITGFHEKKIHESGLINGGIYALNVPSFLAAGLPVAFSFERDYLERSVDTKKIYGIEMEQYFIDIGVPEDYQRFQQDFNLILSKNKYKQGAKDYPALEILADIFLGLLD